LLSYARTFRGFDRDVRLYFGVAALLGASVFGGITVVLQNLYLLRIGYGPEAVGAVNAASQIALAAFSLPAAILGRRFGSRNMLLLAIALLALGNACLPLAEAFAEPSRLVWLLAAAAIANVGIALLLVNDKAFVMGVTTAEQRNHVYSMLGAAWPLAAFVGGLIAGILPFVFAKSLGVGPGEPAPYRYALLVSAGLAAAGFVVMTRTRGPSAEVGGARATASGRAPIGLILAMSLVVFAQAAGESSVRTFFNVYLDQGLGVATPTIGALAALAALVGAFAALSMPFFARRLGRPRTYVLGSVAVVASMLPLALVADLRAAGLGYVGVVAFTSLARPCNIVFQLELVRQEWRGLMAGATTLAFGVSAALVSLLGGYLIAGTGYSALFLACGLVTLVGVAWFWAYFRTPRGEYVAPRGSLEDSRGQAVVEES